LRSEDFAIGRDFVPSLYDAEREAGTLPDAKRAALRAAWLAGWRARTAPANFPFLWLTGYARTVDDRVEADEAAAAMAELGRPPFHPLSYPDRGIGLTLLLTDHAADAVPILDRASRTCHAVEFTSGIELAWESTRAARDLGRALEATGDVEGACGAYRRVLARWGGAKPRSVTADFARDRLSHMACSAP
jgi:serine/threonine-protein kinase